MVSFASGINIDGRDFEKPSYKTKIRQFEILQKMFVCATHFFV